MFVNLFIFVSICIYLYYKSIYNIILYYVMSISIMTISSVKITEFVRKVGNREFYIIILYNNIGIPPRKIGSGTYYAANSIAV